MKKLKQKHPDKRDKISAKLLRFQKSVWLVGIDEIFFTLSLFLAFQMRLNESRELVLFSGLIIYLPVCCALIKIATLFVFGAYKRLWKFADIPYALLLLGSLFVSQILFYICALTFLPGIDALSILLLDFLFSSAYLIVSRFSFHIINPTFSAASDAREKKRLLIIGAGEAGYMIYNDIRRYPDLNIYPVAFADDNPEKSGMKIGKCPVAGTLADIPKLCARYRVTDIIIAMPSAPQTVVNSTMRLCLSQKVHVRIIPGTKEIIAGKAYWRQGQEATIEDYVGRAEIKLDITPIKKFISGKTVLVTGAGGSIGSEICRQILPFQPTTLILLGHDENAIYDIQQELSIKRPNSRLKLIPVIASVRDAERLNAVFTLYKPAVVFHAAAHKHVPLMEQYPIEAVRNNILGSRNLIETAIKHKVKKFVLISTDKAVNPVSVMGMTKRVTEFLLRGAAQDKSSATQFVAVRFGNVLESNGSVIPLFKRQIAAGGPVTITHKDMLRYFMTIPEASRLVLQAASLGKGGEIFILDMGQPFKILELAERLILMSGHRPYDEIPIVFTGLRPGEKITEELLTKTEGIAATRYEKIFVASPEKVNRAALNKRIDALARRLPNCSPIQIKAALADIIKKTEQGGKNA